MTRQATGARGERIASDHLRQHGYCILATNWHCPAGELDIVARDPTSETLVFVEVRTRTAASTEDAFASITPRKRERLLRAVAAYLDTCPTPEPVWRLDVIAVALRAGAHPLVQHVEDALGW